MVRVTIDFVHDDPWKVPEWRRPAPDKAIAFCKANGVAMHGHALIYVASVPTWVWKAAAGSPERAGHWFDRHMTKKAVWHEMNRLINGEWRTRLSLRADSSGNVSFCGFKGRYRLSWKDSSGAEHAKSAEVK